MRQINRFANSVRPEVALKKDAVCSLKLHFYGCLRQYVNALEYKAQIDSERFVYASENYFVEYCKRFSRRAGQGEPYKKRIIRYCKQFLRKNGVIGEQVWRVRKGKLREGFIVAVHDSVAHTDGQTCTILPSSALSSTLCCAVPSALSSAVPNEENGASECPSECPITTSDVIDNVDDYSDDEQKSFRKVKTVSAPNAVMQLKSANAGNADQDFSNECEAEGLGLESAENRLHMLNIESQAFGRGRRW